MNNYLLLYKLPGKLDYWLLPRAHNITQDLLLQPFTCSGIVQSRYIAQQDGSRLKVLRSKHEQPEIIYYLQEKYNTGTIYQQDIINNNTDLIFKLNKYYSKLKFAVYWTHTFLNGARIVPVAINEDLWTFYDLSTLWPQFTPEDDFGLLISYDENGPLVSDSLILEGPEVAWELIEYFSYLRMCPCCGVVSNRKKPRKSPWIGIKAE